MTTIQRGLFGDDQLITVQAKMDQPTLFAAVELARCNERPAHEPAVLLQVTPVVETRQQRVAFYKPRRREALSSVEQSRRRYLRRLGYLVRERKIVQTMAYRRVMKPSPQIKEQIERALAVLETETEALRREAEAEARRVTHQETWGE